MRVGPLLFVLLLAIGCGGDDDNETSTASEQERIAFGSSRDGDFEIYTMRPDGSDVRQLTRNEETKESESRDDRPAWSPDGRWIAFVSTRDHPLGGVDRDEIYVMRADGSGQKRLTENRIADFAPGWTEDGEIVFWRCRDGVAGCELHRVDRSGDDREVVYETADVVAESSGPHDGEVFARILSRQTMTLRGGELIAIDVENDEIRTRGQEGIPSPDGGQLLIATDRDKNGPCLFHDCEGHAPELYVDDHRLTRTTGEEGDAAWSPGGRRIAFARIPNANDDYELWVMNADGTCQTQLTENGEWDWAPDWYGRSESDRPLEC